jgi:ribosomal protein L32
MRKRQRVAQLEKPILAEVGTCPACGAAVRSHRACTKCGTYNGRKVIAAAE